MLYKYKFLMRLKINVISQEDFPNYEKWTRCEYPKWEVVLGAPDNANIPCLMHATRLCQLDVKMTND